MRRAPHPLALIAGLAIITSGAAAGCTVANTAHGGYDPRHAAHRPAAGTTHA